jgi:SAM-dependent methyltransferase
MVDSGYDNPRAIAKAATEGRHRAVIGGGWDVIGALQLSFLRANGLKPEHSLLDVGCGSLRGGVHLVPYLNAGNYYGIDINQPLLDAGYDKEIVPMKLADKLPRTNLAAVGDFNVAPVFNRTFDYLLAVSVFTHLNWNRIRQGMENLAAVARADTIFFASYFHLPEEASANEPLFHPPGPITTHGHRDAFHYRVSDFEQAIRNLPWRLDGARDWNHPRGQRMLTFIRTED